jgi:hypothetical protein
VNAHSSAKNERFWQRVYMSELDVSAVFSQVYQNQWIVNAPQTPPNIGLIGTITSSSGANQHASD